MKKSVIITVILMILMFVVTGIFVSVMPESVPIHFDAKGVADAYGSPITYMIFPVCCVFITCLLVVAQVISRVRGLSSDNQALAYITNGVLALLSLINLCICINAFIYGKPNAYVHGDFMIRIIFVGLGVFQIFFSHWIPMLPRHRVPEGKKTLSEESYGSIMQFVKKSGMFMGGMITLPALFVPLIPETILVVASYAIWSIIVSVYAIKKLRTESI